MSFTEKDYQELLKEFRERSDEAYKKFNESLIPGTQTAYGVRVPEMRRMARAIVKNDPEGFLAVSRTDSYEEILLRGIVIASMKTDHKRRLALTEEFLPLIDNWAVCDIFCGTFSLKKPEEREVMWQFLQPLFQDSREFYARFAAVMLLSHFTTKEKLSEALALLEGMRQEQYYVRMAVAWAVSICYVKFPRETERLLKSAAFPNLCRIKPFRKSGNPAG